MSYLTVDNIRAHSRRRGTRLSARVEFACLAQKGDNFLYSVQFPGLRYFLSGKTDLRNTGMSIEAMCALIKYNDLSRARCNEGRLLTLSRQRASKMTFCETPEELISKWKP